MKRGLFTRICGCIKGQVGLTDLQCVACARRADVDLLGQFRRGRGTTESLRQDACLFLKLLQIIDLTHRWYGDSALLGQCLENGLSNPPNGVGDELEATGFVKTLRALHQAHIALGNEFGQAQAVVSILPCDADDETQITFDDLLAGVFVPRLCAGK